MIDTNNVDAVKKNALWHHLVLLLLAVAGAAFLARFSNNLAPVPSVHATLFDNVSGWAWSENIGWISFNCLNTDACGLVNYGVRVADGTGHFSGYAWSENIGWINFAPLTERNRYPSEPFYSATLNFDTGQVTGWARACAVFAAGCSGDLKPESERGGWDGWIKMAGQSFNERRELLGSWNVVRTTIGPGVCQFEGYAWGGEVIGWINFRGTNYGVNTSLCNVPPDVSVGETVNSDIQPETSPVEYLPIDWMDYDTIQTSFSPPDLPDLDVMLDFANMEFSDLFDFTFPDLFDFLLNFPFEELEAPEELNLEEMLLDAGQDCIDAIFATIDAQTALAEAQATEDPEAIAAAEQTLAEAQAAEDAACGEWQDRQDDLELAELRLSESWRLDGPVSVNYCTFPLQPTFSWTFTDSDPGDVQTAYQVQIATRKHFQDQFIVWDSGKIPSSLSTYTLPQQDVLQFGETYYWRVRAWDGMDHASEWAEGPAYVAPPHAFPTPGFTVVPQNPTVDATTAFTDASRAAAGRIVRWRWRFEDAIPGVARTQNAETIFHSPGMKRVSLEVTDSDGLTCSTDDILPQTINIIGPVEFREI